MRAACESVAGVKTVDVDFDNKKAIVTYDAARATPEAFLKAIQGAGYTPAVASAEAK